MWVALSILVFLFFGFLPFLLFCGDAIVDWIKAKAEEIRARAERIRHDISDEQKRR